MEFVYMINTYTEFVMALSHQYLGRRCKMTVYHDGWVLRVPHKTWFRIRDALEITFTRIFTPSS
jgi:hypothetical protein